MTALRTSLRDYLAMRRGLGFKLRDAGASLLDFVSFMERKRASRITTRLALKWAQKSKSTLPMDWARRLSFVRGFARYLNAIDSRSEIPPNGLLPYRPQRTRPYIYTEQQIEQLLAAALTLPPAGGLRRWTYHCPLGLFTVTGLRLGEALSLKLDDVDLHEKVLTIRGAKYGKSRLIPIHPSTRKVLVSYLQRRERFLVDAICRTCSCPGPAIDLVPETCTGPSICCRDKSDCARLLQATARDCMTSVIASRLRPCWVGTGPEPRSSRACRSCRLILGTFA